MSSMSLSSPSELVSLGSYDTGALFCTGVIVAVGVTVAAFATVT